MKAKVGIVLGKGRLSQEIGYVPCECLLYVPGLGVEGGSGRPVLCPSW